MKSIDQVNYIDQTTRIIWHFAITANRAFDINPMPSRRYNHIHQISDKNILSAITAKRAFRGMAGLAVLYPSVVDYIDRRLKTL